MRREPYSNEVDDVFQLGAESFRHEDEQRGTPALATAVQDIPYGHRQRLLREISVTRKQRQDVDCGQQARHSGPSTFVMLSAS